MGSIILYICLAICVGFVMYVFCCVCFGHDTEYDSKRQRFQNVRQEERNVNQFVYLTDEQRERLEQGG